MPNRTDILSPADAARDSGILREFLGMMKQHRNYWLLPVVSILLLFGVIIVLGSTAAAPFIYSLF